MNRKSFYVALLATVFVLILTTTLIVIFTQKSNQDQQNPTSSYNNQTQITKSTSPEKPSTTSNNVMLFAVIFVLSVATATSVMTSFYLYSWRKRFLRKPNVLVPEEWGKYLDGVGKGLNDFGNEQGKLLNQLMTTSQENTSTLKNMIETYMSLQNSLEEKDKEISRLKKGYDREIYKKFLYRFIKVDEFVSELIFHGESDIAKLNKVKMFLEDALEESDVEIYSPEIGEDVRKVKGVSDNIVKVETDILENDYRISEVISAGYKISSGDNYEYIVPAKVKIFVFQGKG